jgi:hypothetical protein
VDDDRLSRCLASLLEQLRRGLEIENPVGLMKTMIFKDRCSSYRRSNREARAMEYLRTHSEDAYLPDPLGGLLSIERNTAVFNAVSWDLNGATPAVVWEHAAGIPAKETADRLTAGWEERWTAARVRREFYKAKQELRRSLGRFSAGISRPPRPPRTREEFF